MKKIISLILTLWLLCPTHIPNCTHAHNSECGYNPNTHDGCTHVHTDECFGIEPADIYDPNNPIG